MEPDLRGYRWTPQRRLIYRLLQGRPHAEVDWLYAQARRQYPNISFATIYRSLGVLKVAGLVNNVRGKHYSLWESDTTDHYHLYCTECHDVFDIPAMSLPIDASKLGRQKFEVRSIDVEITGICPPCRTIKSKK